MKLLHFLMALTLATAPGLRAAVFTVNIAGDAPDALLGDGKADTDNVTPGDQTTLRAAIQEANFNGTTLDTITFSGVTLINVNSFPTITQPVVIDGGSSRVEIRGSANNDGSFTLIITGGGSTLRGLALGAVKLETGGGNTVQNCYIGLDAAGTTRRDGRGLFILDSASNTIGGVTVGERNVISGNAPNGSDGGITIQGAQASGNRIISNFIGTTVDGAAALPNAAGIVINGAADTVIGGLSEGERNVISGNNNSAIFLNQPGATRTIIRGNYIGVNAAGGAAVGNGFGVFCSNAPANIIGGSDAAARNVISGNSNQGVAISGSAATGNVVTGNYIGVDASGANAVRNNQGINISSAQNVIGGSTAGERNVISGNGIGIFIAGDGSAVGNRVEGNLIGPKADGGNLGNDDGGILLGGNDNIIGGIAAGAGNVIAYNKNFRGVGIAVGTGNAILGNSIFENAGLGIDLGGGGVDDNDTGDLDTGANNLQNYPELKANDTGGIDGKLSSEPNKSYRIEFFSVPEKDSSGHGEGKTFISSANVTTDATGVATIAVPGGEGFISATATEIVGGVPRNTSEFSEAVKAGGGPPPSGLVVDSPGDEEDVDPGDGRSQTALGTSTLRSAIEEANATKNGERVIKFNLAGSPPFAIKLALPLPQLKKPMTIDGSSQPGFAGTPVIELDGVNLGAEANGLSVRGGKATVRALAFTRFEGYAIELLGKGGNAVEGCKISACRFGVGVRAANNTIGGLTVAKRNVIAGNASLGIALLGAKARNNRVQGTFISGNGAADVPVGQSAGIAIAQAGDNLIGGLEPGARNVISGNLGAGIYIAGSRAERNRIEGNFIGTVENGTAALANKIGIQIDAQASGNVIGGLDTAARNIISGNSQSGVLLNGGAEGNDIIGNYIGTDVSGSSKVENLRGVELNGASKNRIGSAADGGRNVISGNGFGVVIEKSQRTIVQGNYIGSRADGLTPLPNEDATEGLVVLESGRTTIGGRGEREGNLISGHNIGLDITQGTEKTVIQGNLIGTDASGDLPLPNRFGVWIDRPAGTEVGGQEEGAGNVISGNSVSGIQFIAPAPRGGGSVVQGNSIGVGKNGGPLGNGKAGVEFEIGASGNLLGSTRAEGANVIAFNGTAPGIGRPGGVLFSESGPGNAVLGNIITSNVGLGIDLSGDGVTLNDNRDADSEPNGFELQNYPVLESALTAPSVGRIIIAGSLNSTPGKVFRIEFFACTGGDASGHGEGDEFIGSTQVATDATGNKAFTVGLNHAVEAGVAISATATEIVGKKKTPRGTSEFSVNILATAVPGATALARERFQARGALRFLETDGDRVEVRAANDVLVRFEGEHEPRLVAVGANVARSVWIKVERGSRGDGVARLGGIEVLGGLRSIIAPDVDIGGEGIHVSGPLRTLIVRDVLDGADVLLGGSADDRTAIGVRAIGDGTLLQSGSSIELLRAVRIGASEIVAPALETLRVRESFNGELNVPGESRIWLRGRRER